MSELPSSVWKRIAESRADRIEELEAALRETEDHIATIASKEGDRYNEWFDLKEKLERKRIVRRAIIE